MSESFRRQSTCSAALGRRMLEFACARGFEESTILALLQTTREVLDDPDARLPTSAVHRYWNHVAGIVDDPGIPIQFAGTLRPGDLGILGFAIMTAASGLEALRRAARYYGLLADTAHLVLELTEEGIRVEFQRAGERDLALRIMNESSVASVLHLARLMTGSAVDPLCVAFRHPEPRSLAAHRPFFRAPLQFGASWDGLHLPAALLERVPTDTNRSMGAFFERQARDLLHRLSADLSFAERVRAAISHALAGGEPGARAIARHLGTSERSLRRQLRHENASFRDLVDEVRRERARDYLANTRASVTEIAYLLGFSEVSAFSRAYRRWYGESPRSHRRTA